MSNGVRGVKTCFVFSIRGIVAGERWVPGFWAYKPMGLRCFGFFSSSVSTQQLVSVAVPVPVLVSVSVPVPAPVSA